MNLGYKILFMLNGKIRGCGEILGEGCLPWLVYCQTMGLSSYIGRPGSTVGNDFLFAKENLVKYLTSSQFATFIQ
jgi:hypothetical protein